MDLDGIRQSILQKQGCFLSLDELTALIVPADYFDLCAAVSQLLELCLLKQIGSPRNTNGMVPPLRLKYRILRPQVDDTDTLSEIRQLSTELNISGYLQKPELYRKHRDILLPFNNYIKKRNDRLANPMSKNERAFSVWKNEKQLDSARCQSVLRFNGWENRLNYYPTPEPFFDYLAGRQICTLLILENKDPWYTLRRLFLQFPERHKLFGLRLDGIVFGEGRKATRPHALEEYAALLQSNPPRFFYFGDLDYAGIDIFLSAAEQNPSLNVSLFLPAYQAMLRRGREDGYGRAHTDQARPERMAEFLSLFAQEEAAEIEKMLAEGRYLPQEILTCPYLQEQLLEEHDV
jgi:hypothetical protein